LHLSETYEGTVHDKKICDLTEYQFPEKFLLRYDLGFLGYTPENIMIEVPFKNSKLNPLTQEMKQKNKEISAKRVSIEQAISGIKRLKIVGDKIRSCNTNFRHQVMLIACGMHNLRVKSSLRAYAHTRTKLNFNL